MKRFVVVHDNYGIFLGHSMGLLFWSLLDTVGQSLAPTVEEADELVTDLRAEDTRYHLVELETVGEYATCAELRAAGLGDLLGDMPQNELIYMPAAGRC